MICQRRRVASGVPPLKGGGNPAQLTQTVRTTQRRLNAVPRKHLTQTQRNLAHELMLNPAQNRNNPAHLAQTELVGVKHRIKPKKLPLPQKIELEPTTSTSLW